MDPWTIVAAGVVAIGLVVAFLAFRGKDPMADAVAAAVDAEDPTPIMEAMEAQGKTDSPTTWHRVLDNLWQDYERELAAKVVKKAAEVHESDTIKHWVQRVVEVEPEMAKRLYSRRFIIETLELDKEALASNDEGPKRPRRGFRQKK